jgi:anhydro-N-acetylmuramic acid kinase
MTELYLGLMSGTSMDGVDAVLCEFDGTAFRRVVATRTCAYPAALRSALLHLQRARPAVTLERLGRLDHAVARTFARAATGLLARAKLEPAQLRAIGSHGQTVFHDPAGAKTSTQLGDPSLIAGATGVTTVADFRRADVARGGQGAPLVPAFHHAVFATAAEARCVVNIGGIANITVLPDAEAANVRGFDTGPGNALLDEWSLARRRKAYDAGGRWGATGDVDARLLRALLAEPWLRRRPPKSTGRDQFNLTWARRRYPALKSVAPADAQRTFAELTARSIADAIRLHAPGTRRVLVCGGGVDNGLLMSRLGGLLATAAVVSTTAYGLDPRQVEGAAFAWLAMRTLHGLPGNVPGVTGARSAAVLGGIYRGEALGAGP